LIQEFSEVPPFILVGLVVDLLRTRDAIEASTIFSNPELGVGFLALLRVLAQTSERASIVTAVAVVTGHFVFSWRRAPPRSTTVGPRFAAPQSMHVSAWLKRWLPRATQSNQRTTDAS
jgi:hypothetical protein